MKKQLFICMLVALLPMVTFAQDVEKVNQTNKQGQKQGYWIDKNPEFEIIGNYLNNQKDGAWLTHLVESSMLIRIENYKQGKKDGLFLELSKRGSLVSEQYFTNDQPNGPYRLYGNNGILASESNFLMGKFHGPQTTYYENLQNKKAEEANYKYGIKDGPSRWYDTEGNLIVEYNYVDGLLQGGQKSFFTDGKVKTSDLYVNNILDGASTEYYENGNIKITGQFKAGLMDGKWLEYDENGKLLKTMVYSGGKIK